MQETIPREARNWATFCHLSGFAGFVFPLGSIIGPLVLWLVKREEWPFVDDQGKEALNFQISWMIYMLLAIIPSFFLIGIPILIGLFIAGIILVILAAIRSNEGERYRYPMTIRFI